MSSTLDLLHRHSFAWIADPESVVELATGETPHDDVAILRKWLGKGYPLIIRRPCLSEDGSSLCVGLALPPNPSKRRLAFRIPFAAVGKIVDPPLWTNCATAASPQIAAVVKSILSATDASGLPLLTFGSYAWQFHTGLPYVTPHSDLDLLVPIDHRVDWQSFRQSMTESRRTHHRVDLEIVLNGDASFNWREFGSPGPRLLFKGNQSVWMGNKSDVEDFSMNSLCLPRVRLSPASIARCAANALAEELATYPKPGLVSFVDQGSHPDMDAECFLASIEAIGPYFGDMAKAGAAGCRLLDLQRIGIAAEESMLDATGGRNTHRGAIYCLGLLAAAAGKQMADDDLCELSLGRIVAESWGEEILLPNALLQTSRGLEMCHRYRLGGVRAEARNGFPSIFGAGLPAFQKTLAVTDREAARVQAFFAILNVCEDTTLWKRGGYSGWKFARAQVRGFLCSGGVADAGWRERAKEIHRAFVARHLTAGGAADLLAATVFIHDLNREP